MKMRFLLDSSLVDKGSLEENPWNALFRRLLEVDQAEVQASDSMASKSIVKGEKI